MIRIIEVKETITDSMLLKNIYSIQQQVQEVIDRLETSNEMNVDDYNFIQTVLLKVDKALTKVNEIMKI